MCCFEKQYFVYESGPRSFQAILRRNNTSQYSGWSGLSKLTRPCHASTQRILQCIIELKSAGRVKIDFVIIMICKLYELDWAQWTLLQWRVSIQRKSWDSCSGCAATSAQSSLVCSLCWRAVLCAEHAHQVPMHFRKWLQQADVLHLSKGSLAYWTAVLCAEQARQVLVTLQATCAEHAP